MNTTLKYSLTTILGLSLAIAGQAKLSSNNANLTPETATSNEIKLAVESDVDIYGVQFDINYNPSELQLTENAIVSMVPGINLYSKIKDNGIARVLMFSMDGEKILDVNSGNITDLVDINFTPAKQFYETSIVDLTDVTLAGKAGEEVSVTTSSFEVTFATPQKTSLAKNYPNPFNPSTNIEYQIANPGIVSIMIYDLKGALVITLVNEHREANYYNIVWNGLNSNGQSVASGRYIVKMTAPGFSDTITMTLLK